MNLELDADRLWMRSYYAATSSPNLETLPLTTSIQADVAVIGGGLAGIGCALELAERGYEVVLLEAREVGWGASGRNGGQVWPGLACGEAGLENLYTPPRDKSIYALSQEAVNWLKERIKNHSLDCDWQEAGAIQLARTERHKHMLQTQYQAYLNYGEVVEWYEAESMSNLIASRMYCAGIYLPHAGHLHPLKYTLALARLAQQAGVKIFESSRVLDWETKNQQVQLTTIRGKVQAKFAVFAGNVWQADLSESLARKVFPIASQIAATEPLPKTLADSLLKNSACACDNDWVLNYFRVTVDQRFMLGSGVSFSLHSSPQDYEQRLQKIIEKIFPQLAPYQIEYAWGGFIDATRSRAPDFGKLQPHVYYLQGFSGHGLALTGFAGKLVAQSIAKESDAFDEFAWYHNQSFPGGPAVRQALFSLGRSYYALRDKFWP